MNRSLMTASALAATLVASSASHAAVRITEVVYNEVSSSYLGEWIEIYNTGNTAVDLSNYKIGDEETKLGTGNTEGLFQFPANSSIAPGEVQIVASGAARFLEVYGFRPNYEIGSSEAIWVDDALVPNLTVYTAWDADGDRLNMSNSNDQVVLVDDTDTIIDSLSWGGTFSFNPGLNATVGDGVSYSRINALIDTDTAADWALGTNPEGATWAGASAPGTVVIPEPAAASLLSLAALPLLARRRR